MDFEKNRAQGWKAIVCIVLIAAGAACFILSAVAAMVLTKEGAQK